jgi:hypothetical protein
VYKEPILQRIGFLVYIFSEEVFDFLSQTVCIDLFRRWMMQKQEKLQMLQITTEERRRDPEKEEEGTSDIDLFIGYIHESERAIGQITVWASRQMEFEVINIDTEERLLWTYVEQIEEQDTYFETILEPYFGALQSGVKA